MTIQPIVANMGAVFARFSLGNLLGTSVFLMCVNDTFDKSFEMPPDLKDKLIGKPRSSESDVVVNPKGVGSYVKPIFQIGGVMSRNAPAECAGASDVDRWRQLTGTDSGDPRRARSVPPMCQPLHNGTANPCRRGKYAYVKKDLETKGGKELKYILLLLYYTTTLANCIDDEIYGLAGESNSELTHLIQTYVSRSVVDVSWFMRNYFEVAPDAGDGFTVTVGGISRTISVQQLVLKSDVSKLFTKHKIASTIPSTYVTKRKMACRLCGLAFYGIREDHTADVVSHLTALVGQSTGAPNHPLFRYCPKADDGQRCFSMIAKGTCLADHRLKTSPSTLHAVHSVHYQPSTAQ